jgi:hypothetical protein
MDCVFPIQPPEPPLLRPLRQRPAWDKLEVL